MLKAFLNRIVQNDKQTLGHLTLWDGSEKLFDCVTLELAWKDNKRNVSCIPKGVYKVSPRHSETYKNHFILEDVPNRSTILIHQGNFYTNTEGCILVGSRFGQINNDSLLDITASRRTLSKLLAVTEERGFELTIS